MKQVLAVAIAVCLLSMPHKLFADNGDEYLQTAVRLITHSTTDSVVNLYVKISSRSTAKLSDNLFYYWEKNGAVHKNQGSFSGNVLHGRYTVTNAKGLMVTEGYFYNGAKDRQWKRWNNEGMLTQIDSWKKGHLKRTALYSNRNLSGVVTYRQDGSPKKKVDYASKKITYRYKDGDWVAKRKSLSFLSKKRKQQEADTPPTEGEPK